MAERYDLEIFIKLAQAEFQGALQALVNSLKDTEKASLKAFGPGNAVEKEAKKTAAALTGPTSKATKEVTAEFRAFTQTLNANARSYGLISSGAGEVAQRLTRELGNAAVGVGVQFGRLGGITSALAHSLSRQLVRGTHDSVGAFEALFNRTRLVAKAKSDYVAITKLVANVEEPARKKAEAMARALYDQRLAQIGAASSAATMGLALGGATILIAGMALSTVALTAGLRELVQRGLEVSKVLEAVAVRAPKSAFDDLKRSVFELSNTTGVAFDQLGTSLGRALLKTGGDAARAQKLLKVATDTALASASEPAQAVERLGDLMRSYGLEIENVKALSNDLLIVQRTSKEEFSAIAEGLNALAPQTKNLGIGFNEIAAAVAGITTEGVPAQQAIFGLRSIFAELEREGSRLSTQLGRLKVDFSPEAFRSKGIIRVFAEMELALNRVGSSLSKFLGESRRGPTLAALLGGGAKAAEKALAEMTSGVDQASEAIARLQALPGRGLANLLNELTNLFRELGDVLVTFLGPIIKDVAGFFREVAALAREHPELAIAAFKDFVVELAGLTQLPFAKTFTNAVINNFDKIGVAARLAAEKVHTIRAALGGAKEAIDRFNDTKILPPDATSPADLFLIPEGATDQIKALNDQFKRRDITEFISNMEALRDRSGDATEFLDQLTESISKNADIAKDQLTALAAEVSFGFATASEKQARVIEEGVILADLFSVALKDLDFDTTNLNGSIERWTRTQERANAVTALAERSTDAAALATERLAKQYKIANEQIDIFTNKNKALFERLAELNELLFTKQGGTGEAGTSVFLLTREYDQLGKALDDTMRALDTYDAAQMSNIELLELQASRVRELADTIEEEMPRAAQFMRNLADAFEQNVLDPRRRGFFGGVEEAVREMVKQVRDGFGMGKQAAFQFGQEATAAISGFLNTLGTSGNSLRELFAGLLGAVRNVISEMIAATLVAEGLNLLFGKGKKGGAVADSVAAAAILTTATTAGAAVLGTAMKGGATAIVFGCQIGAAALTKAAIAIGAAAASLAIAKPVAMGGVYGFAQGGVAGFAVGGASDLRAGGVAHQPTVFAVAEKQGMHEAFVPLPGPGRGIPVEFKNRSGGGGQTNVVIQIQYTSNSLDPRTGDEIFMQRMPMISRGIAAAIHNHQEHELVSAIRGVGR